MTNRPTDIMEAEHRVIEQLAAAMVRLAEAAEAGRRVEPALLLDIVDFMRSYADRCHHGKEEELLFPLLLQRGVPPTGCPIGALSQEHVAARQLVGELAQAAADCRDAPPGQEGRIPAALRALAALYPGHIWKEDYLLFPMTNKVLGAEDQERLAREFDTADEAFGRERIKRYEAFADELFAAT